MQNTLMIRTPALPTVYTLYWDVVTEDEYYQALES